MLSASHVVASAQGLTASLLQAARGLTVDIVELALDAAGDENAGGAGEGAADADPDAAAEAAAASIKTPRLSKRTLMFPFAHLTVRARAAKRP